jgi:hypothetical protein
MTPKPLKKGAMYDDLRDVPDHFVAEMFDGDLHASPRPALPHANAASALLSEIHRSSAPRRSPQSRSSWARSGSEHHPGAGSIRRVV